MHQWREVGVRVLGRAERKIDGPQKSHWASNRILARLMRLDWHLALASKKFTSQIADPIISKHILKSLFLQQI